MQDAQRKGILTAASLLVLIGLGTVIGDYSKQHPKVSPTPGFSLKTEKTISYQGQDGKTVLELLRQNHTVEVQDSDYGALVTSIDGVAQKSTGGDSGATGKQPSPGENAIWLYYIDGQPATQAADKMTTKNGQTVEWRYETF